MNSPRRLHLLKIWGFEATYAVKQGVVKRFPAFPLKIKMVNVMEPLNQYLSRQNERKKKRLPDFH